MTILRNPARRIPAGWWQAGGGIVVIAVATLIAVASSYDADVIFSIAVAAAAAAAWNISAGYAGDLSLGHGVFYGLGAYASTILLTELGVTPWLGTLAGAAMAGVIAGLLGLVTIRLRGPFFAIATLGLLEICAALSLYFVSLTKGGSGISILAPYSLVNMAFAERWPYVVLILLVLALITGVSAWIHRSGFGFRLRAFRDNETAARALGIPPVRARIIALMISAVLTALVGGVQAQYLEFISPSSAFSLVFSVQIALVAIVGGIGTVYGPVIGACIIIPIGTLLVPAFTSAGGSQQLVYGALLVVALLLFRGGAVGLIGWARRQWESRRGTAGAEAGPAGADAEAPPPAFAGPAAVTDSPAPEPPPAAATGGQPVLVVEDIAIAFGGVRALDHVSLQVERGSITAVIGPNGAGKSTLFSILSGFAIPSAGRVQLDGQDITAARPENIVGRGLVRTFQTSQLFAQLTVLENVLIGALDSAPDLATARLRAADLLDELDLARFAGEQATALSLGDRRRLELARALATQPSVLLLDEILAGLSTREYEETIEVLRATHRSGVTILMTEHIMDAIIRMCDQVYVLDHGKIIASGRPDQVQSDPRVVEAYLGQGVGDAQRP